MWRHNGYFDYFFFSHVFLFWAISFKLTNHVFQRMTLYWIASQLFPLTSSIQYGWSKWRKWPLKWKWKFADHEYGYSFCVDCFPEKQNNGQNGQNECNRGQKCWHILHQRLKPNRKRCFVFRFMHILILTAIFVSLVGQIQSKILTENASLQSHLKEKICQL